MDIEIEKSDLFTTVFSTLNDGDMNIWIAIYSAAVNGANVNIFSVYDRHRFLNIVFMCIQSIIHPDFHSRPAEIDPEYADRLYSEIGCLRSAQNIVMYSLFGNDDVEILQIAA